MDCVETVLGRSSIDEEVNFWINEVKEELKEIDQQQHDLIRRRTKSEGTLRWLNNLQQHENSLTG